MLRKRAASARLRAVLGEVEEQIRGGAALSQAFAAQGRIFPRIYTASILAGERSGALDDVLSRYVNYMRRNVGLATKDSRRSRLSGVPAVCVGLHGDLSDDLCGAAHVGSVFRIWQRSADGHSNRCGTIALDVGKCDLVWAVGNWRVRLAVYLVANAAGRLQIERIDSKDSAGREVWQFNCRSLRPRDRWRRCWPAVSRWSSRGRLPPNRLRIWNCGDAARRYCR